MTSTADFSGQISRLKKTIADADAVLIGAGAGLSTSAGFTYDGARFEKYFADFREKYGFQDMYSGGFYSFPTLEEHWAFWSRFIWINRYARPPKPVYEKLFRLVSDKPYFVLTTNVDHCFQRAGFDRQRLFYTQGDYGLWQCGIPCHKDTYDNKDVVKKMVEAQGYRIDENGGLYLPEGVLPKRKIPRDLIPYCPKCKSPMQMNLRADATFVEDEGWRLASKRYIDFLHQYQDKNIVYLELAVGCNTPAIIKYPFWQMTAQNPESVYVCLNFGEAYAPDEISKRSICIDNDIGDILDLLLQ